MHFAENSYKLTSESIEEIKKFAEFLKENSAYKVELIGYMNYLGSDEYNYVLSIKRAKAVYEELIKLGISKERLSFVGYGDKDPVASNATLEGRAKNRRVVARLYF